MRALRLSGEKLGGATHVKLSDTFHLTNDDRLGEQIG